MAKEYVPIFFDWLEVTQDLTAEEKGNLIDAVVSYASGAEYEHFLTGACKVAFRFMKGQVDRNTKISEARSAAGSSKPEQTLTNNNKPEQNPTNDNKPEQNETKFPKENNNNKEKDKENDINVDDDNARTREDSSMISLEEATRIRNEHEAVLNAAETAGFPRTDAVRAKLISLYTEHGMEKMLSAINSCVEYGVTTIAYLKGVLKGEPKRPTRPPGKTVLAQQYSQRDYATDPGYKEWEERQQREIEEKIAEMEARKKAEMEAGKNAEEPNLSG